MIDPLGRTITYLRLSLTDRCDLRCVYCMAEDMTFLPKPEILSLEELERLAAAFVRLGVRKLRLTGGEPLVRRGAMDLIARLGAMVHDGRLDELTLTTNGTLLTRFAEDLRQAGIRRINVSLDSLDPQVFKQVTRRGELTKVLAGIGAAQAAGLAVKINTVVLKGVNDHEIDRMIAWCGEAGIDMTLIETMPLGEIEGYRTDQYVPLDTLKSALEERWTLKPVNYTTGGPSRYVEVVETGRKLGFITPLTEHFCASCNRVRVTCTGTLYPCLGQEHAVDLRAPMRASEADETLEAAIRAAIGAKAPGHDFVIDEMHMRPKLARHMNTTGG